MQNLIHRKDRIEIGDILMIQKASRSLQTAGKAKRAVTAVSTSGEGAEVTAALTFRNGVEATVAVHVTPVYITCELKALSDETGETASFYVREGTTRLCLFRSEPAREIRHSIVEGVPMPIERGAAGKILMAYAEDPAPGTSAMRTRKRWEDSTFVVCSSRRARVGTGRG